MVRLATLEDIDSIKKIADKYTKEIGFVLRPALVEHCNKKKHYLSMKLMERLWVFVIIIIEEMV